jgi:hypothetical protein
VLDLWLCEWPQINSSGLLFESGCVLVGCWAQATLVQILLANLSAFPYDQSTGPGQDRRAALLLLLLSAWMLHALLPTSRTSSFCITVLTNHCHCCPTNFHIRWWDSSLASPSLYFKYLHHVQICNGDSTVPSNLKRVRIELRNRHSLQERPKCFASSVEGLICRLTFYRIYKDWVRTAL